MKCGIQYPNTDIPCRRAVNHRGDHKANGLSWSHADVLAALAPPPPPVPAKGPPKLCAHCGRPFDHLDNERRLEGGQLLHGRCWPLWALAKLQHDPVDHPKHYTNHPSGVECLDIVQYMNFCRGGAIKYIWRAGMKGPPIEDLKKAIVLLETEIKRLENGGT